MTRKFALAGLTSDEVRGVSACPPTAVLVPIGSVEPHGPHLPLATDTLLSEEAADRAAAALTELGVAAYVAPSVPYGVTEFAAGFAGAIGVPPEVLTSFLAAIVGRFLGDGWSHVSLVNNHLEPAHDAAVRAVLQAFPSGSVSVACPLTRRWGKTMSDEFKRGNCHAGRYETSLVLAAGGHVAASFQSLDPVDISLSEGIKAGKATFSAMGLTRAYTGSPALATVEEGESLFERLATMIVVEVTEGLESRAREGKPGVLL